MTDKQKLKEHTLDEAFKKLIANRAVLAPILHEVVDGFRDYSIEKIAACIKPSAVVGSSDDKQAKVLNLEDYGEDEESRIVYDCLVELDAAKIPGQVYANIVVDTEMQHDKPKYVLAVFTNHLGDSKLTELIRKDREARKGAEEVMTLDEVVRREGIEQGREEGMEEGIEKGIEKGIIALVEICKEVGIPYEVAVEKVAGKLNLAREEAEEKVKEYWDRYTTN